MKRQEISKNIMILACFFLLFSSLLLSSSGCNESFRVTGLSAKFNIVNLRPDAMMIIRQALADSDPRIRSKAIEVVADTYLIELMPKVTKLLKDDYVPVRFAAALAIGQLQYNLAKDKVKQLLNDTDVNIKVAAAYAMAKLGSKEHLSLIRNAIKSKEQTIRANATMLLGKIGDESDLKILYWAMRDNNSDDKVSFQAAEAIAAIGDEKIYSKLWAMLISVYADDRVLGIRAMGKLRSIDAKNSIITMLDDNILEVRLAAAQQLGILGDYTGEPEVLAVFNEKLTQGMEKNDIERVYTFTALAIGNIQSDSLAPFLPKLIKNESKIVRIAAAKAVFLYLMKN